MAEDLYQAQCRRDDVKNKAAQSLEEFNKDQQVFFDKALLAALQVSPVVTVWPNSFMSMSENDRIQCVTDTAVCMALELLQKRQTQIDNGEV